MAVNWERIGQTEFDRAIDALLGAMWHAVDEATYHSPDGRGGDGGIDFVADAPSGKTIYQYKYFPDGLRTSGTSRKTQIRKSFRAALKHDPARWVLVAPCKLTPQERTWVLQLGDGHDVTVEILDRVELDLLLINNDDVRRYIDRKVLLEDVRDHQVATAAVTDTDDLAAKVRALGNKAADMDLYWRPDYTLVDGTVTVTARPKRPDAERINPIKFDLALDEDATPEQRESFRRVLGYGVGEEIEFPGVATFKSGPDFMRTDGPGTFRLGKAERRGLGEKVRLELVTRDDSPLGTYEAHPI